MLSREGVKRALEAMRETRGEGGEKSRPSSETRGKKGSEEEEEGRSGVGGQTAVVRVSPGGIMGEALLLRELQEALEKQRQGGAIKYLLRRLVSSGEVDNRLLERILNPKKAEQRARRERISAGQGAIFRPADSD